MCIFLAKQEPDFDGNEAATPPTPMETEPATKATPTAQLQPAAAAAPASQQAQAPPMKRQRPMKVTEMAKPLTAEARAALSASALKRLLGAERAAMLGGVATVRHKVVASLATIFTQELKDRTSPSCIEFVQFLPAGLLWM